MVKYILRRVAISTVVLLVGSVLLYFLITISGDPLEDLRESQSPNRDNQMRQRSANMGLHLPWWERYIVWLRGAASCVIGQCDLGTNREGVPVGGMLTVAASSTLRLVILATLLSIVIGIALGILTAIRQYSGFDYAVTFMAFLFFSLPVFWAAVLLKEYAAIRFNNWLADPNISLFFMIGAGLVAALAVGLAVGGGLRRILISMGATFAFVVGILYYFDVVRWFTQPSVGLPVFILASAGAAALILAMTMGFDNRKVVTAVGATTGIGIVAYAILRGMLLSSPSTGFLLLCFAFAILVAVACGYLLGGFSRKHAIGLSIGVAMVMSFIALMDLMLTNWSHYYSINKRPIPTIGAVTPNLNGDYWQSFIDVATHLMLPTLVLMLVSLAGYTRYTRASMLEVLNQDYIRTARSKGLPERTVITKHAFRNSLIPLTTIVAFDFAGLIGGAVITETVFGWKGMGELFRAGLANVDPPPVMAFFLVTGIAAIVMNLVADLMYAVLDPRITR
ncbi:MAG: ABC transporter permease [bacterium]|nr:ABC transporter permease [bacterium]